MQIISGSETSEPCPYQEGVSTSHAVAKMYLIITTKSWAIAK